MLNDNYFTIIIEFKCYCIYLEKFPKKLWDPWWNTVKIKYYYYFSHSLETECPLNIRVNESQSSFWVKLFLRGFRFHRETRSIHLTFFSWKPFLWQGLVILLYIHIYISHCRARCLFENIKNNINLQCSTQISRVKIHHFWK